MEYNLFPMQLLGLVFGGIAIVLLALAIIMLLRRL